MFSIILAGRKHDPITAPGECIGQGCGRADLVGRCDHQTRPFGPKTKWQRGGGTCGAESRRCEIFEQNEGESAPISLLRVLGGAAPASFCGPRPERARRVSGCTNRPRSRAREHAAPDLPAYHRPSRAAPDPARRRGVRRRCGSPYYGSGATAPHASTAPVGPAGARNTGGRSSVDRG